MARSGTSDREYPNKITLGLSDEGWNILTDLVAHFKKRRLRKSTAGGVIDSLLIIARKDGASMSERIEALLPIRSARSVNRGPTNEATTTKARRK